MSESTHSCFDPSTPATTFSRDRTLRRSDNRRLPLACKGGDQELEPESQALEISPEIYQVPPAKK